jgi:hypothetical protein
MDHLKDLLESLRFGCSGKWINPVDYDLYELTQGFDSALIEDLLAGINEVHLENVRVMLSQVNDRSGPSGEDWGGFDAYVEYAPFAFLEAVFHSIILNDIQIDNKLEPKKWRAFEELEYLKDADVIDLIECAVLSAHLNRLESELVTLLRNERVVPGIENIASKFFEEPGNQEFDSTFRYYLDEQLAKAIFNFIPEDAPNNTISHYYYILMDKKHLAKGISGADFLKWIRKEFPHHAIPRIQGRYQIGKSADRFTVYFLAKSFLTDR